MPRFLVPCEWTVTHTFNIEADSLDQAIEKAHNGEGGTTPLPLGQYMDDTFEVNNREAEELNSDVSD